MISLAVQARRQLLIVAASAAFLSGTAISAQTISTVAGNGTKGFTPDGSPATSTQLSGPSNVAFDGSGNLYISDQFNFRVRKVTGATVSTVAGNGTAGYKGDGATASAAEINGVSGLHFDSAGNLYLADTQSHCIRKVVTGGTISTVAGICGTPGSGGDTGAATKANLSDPADVIVDSAGNLYISDGANNRIRKVDTTGIITTFAGTSAPELTGDGGLAINAGLSSPRGLAFDSAGNLYIADSDNNAVRKITPAGIITTIAGTGHPAFSGDGGPATQAELFLPSGVAVDAAGNVFIADDINSRIRKVSPRGTITTIAGNGGFTYTGDGGPATSASLFFPTGVTLDSAGNLFIADSGNNVVRKVTNVGVPALTSVPVVGSGGVISASGFGSASAIAPGSFIEIYGTNLAADVGGWSSFTNGLAPTAVDGTTVTIGGTLAYLSYVSPGQINALVPFGVATGSQPVIVHNSGGSSVSTNVTVNALQPGLLATSAFDIGGLQYTVAFFPDFSTFVLPVSAIAGLTSRPAHAGETIVLFGTGFGTVSPSIDAGQIVTQVNSLVNGVQFSIGGVPAAITYAGLAPGEAGLYQFNVVVPTLTTVPPSNTVPLTFTQSNFSGAMQTLYIAVQD